MLDKPSKDFSGAFPLMFDGGATGASGPGMGTDRVVHRASLTEILILCNNLSSGQFLRSVIAMTDAHGLTALMWVAGCDASAGVDDVDSTITTLIEHGAAPDLKDDRGKTAADIARGLGRERAAKLLER
jgi:hypothetical protein